MLSCRVEQMQSNATRLKRTSWVFQELSSIVAKISCFIGEKHENPSFIENKILFFDESDMILLLTYRDKRMLSNATSFERISIVFKELSSNTPRISCTLGERQENPSFFESKILFFKERYMFLMLICRVKRMILSPIKTFFSLISTADPENGSDVCYRSVLRIVAWLPLDVPNI